MSRIVSILRATHCRSTHHYFALDALEQVDTVPGERLSRLLLQHYSDYLAGAKAPDATFRDFQNHVLHVADGQWGGAPQACESWLKQAIDHLDRRQWKQAAFACGVLSHYFTDPLMPLHTSQSERESVVHGPLEWSVFKAYDSICQSMSELQLQAKIEFSHGPNWISKAVVAGAHVAHQHYERLLDIYDLAKGVRNPAAGLTDEARVILAELFSVVHTGWARVLCRIADETTAEIPNCSLTFASLLATIDMPLAFVLKKFSDAAERRAVAAIFEEYTTTGTVRNHLPLEIQTVQNHRNQALGATASESTAITAPTNSFTTLEKTQRDDRRSRRLETVIPAPDIDPQHATPPSRESILPLSNTQAMQGATDDVIDEEVAPLEPARDSLDHQSLPSGVDPSASKPLRNERGVDVFSPLDQAPSIGPKTSKRLPKIGLLTIGDFLMADATTMQEQLDTRWITVELLEEWQAQARLVCEIPTLFGYQSQLIVAAKCRTSADLAARDPRGLFARISAIVPTSEGIRILRNSKAPQLEDVASWIDAAQHARPVAYRRRAA